MSVAERREREREERRNWILDAAQRAFYAHGVDAVKMRDVAAAAQLGKGTLYLYFRTKEDLVLGVAVRHQKKLIARYEAIEATAVDGVSLLRELLLAYAEHMAEPREHLCMAMTRWASGEPLGTTSRGGDQMRENVRRLFGTLCRAIDRGKADGGMHRDLHTPQTAMSLIGAVNGALLTRLKMDCVGRKVVFPDVEPPTVEQNIDFYLRAVSTGRTALAPVAAAGGE